MPRGNEKLLAPGYSHFLRPDPVDGYTNRPQGLGRLVWLTSISYYIRHDRWSISEVPIGSNLRGMLHLGTA